MYNNCFKIGQHCKLSHVLSLWETVSVALARQHVIRKQVWFEEIEKDINKCFNPCFNDITGTI